MHRAPEGQELAVDCISEVMTTCMLASDSVESIRASHGYAVSSKSGLFFGMNDVSECHYEQLLKATPVVASLALPVTSERKPMIRR